MLEMVKSTDKMPLTPVFYPPGLKNFCFAEASLHRFGG